MCPVPLSEKFLTYAHLEFDEVLDNTGAATYVCGMNSGETAADAEIIENITTVEECYNIANASNELGSWHVNRANA